MPEPAVEQTPIYIAGDPRHTSRELGRYDAAAAKMVANKQFLSISGPDGTKVGTDFAVFLGAVMDCESRVTAWCRPQVRSKTSVHTWEPASAGN